MPLSSGGVPYRWGAMDNEVDWGDVKEEEQEEVKEEEEEDQQRLPPPGWPAARASSR